MEQAAVRTLQTAYDRLMPSSCMAYSSTLKMEATCSSETSADFRQTTRRYIPEDRTLQRIS
jgi:hypothetical protein